MQPLITVFYCHVSLIKGGMLTKNIICLHGRRGSMWLQSINSSNKMNLLLVFQEISTTLGCRLSIVKKYLSILCVLLVFQSSRSVGVLVSDKSSLVILINTRPVIHVVKFELSLMCNILCFITKLYCNDTTNILLSPFPYDGFYSLH